jgi:mono/diheme cytochrome c family protein
MHRRGVFVALLGLMAGLALPGMAQEQSKAPSAPPEVPATISTAATHAGSSSISPQERASRIEGEARFRTNCGRCHMAPHKFPPRIMATAIRHMRVRAMLTDEDMRLILHYMTQ